MSLLQLRSKYFVLLFACSMLSVVGTSAQAADNWNDNTNDHLWSTDANWSNGVAPIVTDSTFIRIGDIAVGGTGPIITGGAYVARNLSFEVQATGGTVSATMTDGTLDLYSAGATNTYFRLGAGSSPGTATFDMSGGTLTVDVDAGLYVAGTNGYVRVGSGYSGVLTLSNDATIIAWDLLIPSSDGAVDLNDTSSIILNGDDTVAVQAFIDAGYLTINGGTGVPLLSYSSGTDLTTIAVVVPEPSTWLMMGMSALFLGGSAVRKNSKHNA